MMRLRRRTGARTDRPQFAFHALASGIFAVIAGRMTRAPGLVIAQEAPQAHGPSSAGGPRIPRALRAGQCPMMSDEEGSREGLTLDALRADRERHVRHRIRRETQSADGERGSGVFARRVVLFACDATQSDRGSVQPGRPRLSPLRLTAQRGGPRRHRRLDRGRGDEQVDGGIRNPDRASGRWPAARARRDPLQRHAG